MGKHLSEYQISMIGQYRNQSPPVSYEKIAKILGNSKGGVYKAYQRSKLYKRIKIKEKIKHIKYFEIYT